MKLRIPNLNLKLIALALALATWFAVRGRTIKDSEWLECPVILSLPDKVVVQEPSVTCVRIRLRGPVEKLADFRPDDWPLGIDATPQIEDAFAGGETAATISLDINRDDFRLPRRLELFDFEPDRILLKVERRMRTVLPVKVTTFGQVADGHEVVETRAMPSTVTLDLGAEEATEIQTVETTPVNVTGSATTVHDAAYLIDPRSGSGGRLDRRVEVTVTIAPKLIERQLKPVPIMLLRQPNDHSTVEVYPETIEISVRGRADLLAGLGPEAAAAYVSIGKEITPGFTYTLLPVVMLKTRGIEVISVPEVKITITTNNE